MYKSPASNIHIRISQTPFPLTDSFIEKTQKIFLLNFFTNKNHIFILDTISPMSYMECTITRKAAFLSAEKK